jgi:hypothetical protein
VKVTDVTRAYHARLIAEREAMDELGYVDLVEEHRLLEQTKLLRDILRAYHAELQAQSRLPRAELRGCLHRAFAAVEDDDLDALTAALLACADAIGRPR